MKADTSFYLNALRLLEKIDNVLILTHRNPDGDAIGSAFALYHLLTAMGKNARIEVEKASEELDFFVFGDALEYFPEDYVVTVDVADKRLLPEEQLAKYDDRVYLAIDHHAANKPFAKHLVLDAEAAATCEIIFDLTVMCGLELPREMNTYLYLGIATDTGCFRYPNCTSHTHMAAATLLMRGANSKFVNKSMFETKTLEYIRFETMALNSLKTYYDGQCAVIVLTQEMFAETGVAEADTHGIAALPRQIKGVKVGIVIKEREDGSFKVSMRSNEPVSAGDICEALGGGGHRLAAGCEPEGDLDSVLSQVLEVVGEALADI